MKILLTMVFMTGGVYLQWQDVRLEHKQARVVQETDVIEQKNEQQRAKTHELKKMLDDMRANPDEIFEELAREKLFMIKPGEIYLLSEIETN